MRVKDLPELDRPRERLLSAGAEALADRELLALLLGSGLAGTDAIDLAARLLARYGTLRALSRADPHDLLALPGVGPAKAARMAAAFQLARRIACEPAPMRISGTADLAAVVSPLLYGLRHERVVVAVCDSAGAVLRTLQLTEGATDRCLIPVRDVVATVLASHGTAFGVAHNHPSGSLDSSPSDRRATARLAEAANAVGLRFLNHVIVTDSAWRTITTSH